MVQVIKAGMGSLPFFKDEDEQAAEDAKAEGKSIEQVQAPSAMPISNRPAVLADGSYATQSALSDTFALPSLSTTQLNLRYSVRYPFLLYRHLLVLLPPGRTQAPCWLPAHLHKTHCAGNGSSAIQSRLPGTFALPTSSAMQLSGSCHETILPFAVITWPPPLSVPDFETHRYLLTHGLLSPSHNHRVPSHPMRSEVLPKKWQRGC